MCAGRKEAVRADDALVSAAELLALENRIRELERVLDRKTLENKIPREAVKAAQKKNLISRLSSLLGEDLP